MNIYPETMPKRTIAAVTTSRADYSHLYWVLRDLEAHPDVELQLIVIAAHMAADFGETVSQIERDGFAIAARVDSLDASDGDDGMARTIGHTALALADVLAELRPDLLLLIADRYEVLAPAAIALALRIPVAHIEGGEVSQGAIDDAVRNAVSKLSHIHFAPTAVAARRLRALGEEPWRIHQTGAPSLDHLRRSSIPSPAEVGCWLGLATAEGCSVVACHPVTIARETLREADAVFAALEQLQGPIVFCFPNADAGGRQLARRARAFCDSRSDAVLAVNLDPQLYWGLLSAAAVLVGNSSSGIMETPSLRLPCVNVGLRQQGRQRAANIIDCPPEAAAIVDAVGRALDPEFRRSLAGLVNPYGDGDAARRIVEVLVSVDLGEPLLMKAPAGASAETPA